MIMATWTKLHPPMSLRDQSEMVTLTKTTKLMLYRHHHHLALLRALHTSTALQLPKSPNPHEIYQNHMHYPHPMHRAFSHNTTHLSTKVQQLHICPTFHYLRRPLGVYRLCQATPHCSIPYPRIWRLLLLSRLHQHCRECCFRRLMMRLFRSLPLLGRIPRRTRCRNHHLRISTVQPLILLPSRVPSLGPKTARPIWLGVSYRHGVQRAAHP